MITIGRRQGGNTGRARARAAAGCAAGALALAALAAGPGAAVAAPPPRCPGVVAYVVPGSASGNAQTNPGAISASVVTHLIADLPSKTVSVVTVPYPAVPVWEGVDNAGGLGYSYLASRGAGVAALGGLLSGLAANRACPGTVAALVGDNQGADVIGQYLDSAVPGTVASRIAAIAMISDPRFNPADTAVDVGSYSPALRGMFATFKVWTSPATRSLLGVRPVTPSGFSYKTVSACNAGDPVCNYSLLAGRICFGSVAWIQYAEAIMQGIPVLIPGALSFCPGLRYPLPGPLAAVRGKPVNTAGIALSMARKITAATRWAQVAAGAAVCGIKGNGTLWCWSYNNYGNLGTGGDASEAHPVQVGSSSGWLQVSSGGYHSCAVKTDHTLWCWGYNGHGQLGTGNHTGPQHCGTSPCSKTPVQVGTDKKWAAVSAGGQYTCALRTDGTLWCWGDNSSGQLGVGSTTEHDSPVQVGTSNGWTEVTASITSGDGHTCALHAGGTLWCWGDNASGQLGVGSTTEHDSPVQVGSGTHWAEVSNGNYLSCAVQTGHTLWCWGSNTDGGLGIGSTSPTTEKSPVQVGTGSSWLTAAMNAYGGCALQQDHGLWCWGNNAFGQVGIGNKTDQHSPVRVGTSRSWTAISAGSYAACGLHADATAWCWGKLYPVPVLTPVEVTG